ncbi:barstar family protein [Thauera linaloolentis]|uniref:Barstar (Barnase inhibitor) n=1 Tax=Thauera linaloolentis (strain DSM 12138 / JCM 21573 / CCUG 41526 / CIP 105981 / IAM 15112 / NBRC 102519 / 47Lol) TaxID=1123367 RepID=N6Z5C1_THAL4|nr:barstar family protein [Thauera linaloolentis]ENO89762.1 Barstar (barnase inhibitor) [Thauera linaloolentis 47Lol = DSM 12138]MCM8566060.1 barstar family protein [Thauera linaloolentis]
MTSHRPHAMREVRIDLAGCTDKAGVLERFATALRFPDWFGHNWDALADALCDLSWLPTPACRIVLSRPSALRAADPEVFATLLEILDDSAGYWAGVGVGFSCEIEENGRSGSDATPPASPFSGR